MRLAFAAALFALAAPALASDLVGPESCRACHAASQNHAVGERAGKPQ